MFDQIADRLQQSFKPVSKLIAINAKALEQLAQQQTTLFTSVLNDSVAYAEGLSTQKDIAGLVDVQKVYAEGVKDKVVASAKNAFAVLTETTENTSEVLKSAFAQAKNAASTTSTISTTTAPKTGKSAK
jgi:phasin family protein